MSGSICVFLSSSLFFVCLPLLVVCVVVVICCLCAFCVFRVFVVVAFFLCVREKCFLHEKGINNKKQSHTRFLLFLFFPPGCVCVDLCVRLHSLFGLFSCVLFFVVVLFGCVLAFLAFVVCLMLFLFCFCLTFAGCVCFVVVVFCFCLLVCFVTFRMFFVCLALPVSSAAVVICVCLLLFFCCFVCV